MTYLIAFACVLGIATGQILFKLSAVSLHESDSWFDTKTLITLFSALKNNQAKLGAAAICNGGGGASAVVIERV